MPQVAGLAIFCVHVSGFSFKVPIFSGFRSHTIHAVNGDRKSGFRM